MFRVVDFGRPAQHSETERAALHSAGMPNGAPAHAVSPMPHCACSRAQSNGRRDLTAAFLCRVSCATTPDAIHPPWCEVEQTGSEAGPAVERRRACDAPRPDALLPSVVLPALAVDKANAQYLFNDTSADFVIDMFRQLGLQNVLCIGTPRLHDRIQSFRATAPGRGFNSYLLDMDSR